MMDTPVRTLLASALLAWLAILIGHSAGATAAPQDAEARARTELSARSLALGLRADLADLRLESVRRGLAGDYVRFQQTLTGVPVLGAEVVVALPARGERPPIVSSHYRKGATPAPTSSLLVGSQQAVEIALDAANSNHGLLRGQPEVQATYFGSGGEYVLGWQVLLSTANPLGTSLVGVSGSDGQVLFVTDLLRFDDGRVFDPNPPKNSGGTIPPPFDCDSAAHEAALAGQYVNKPLLGITTGQGKLKGEFVDLTAPGIIGGYKAAGLANEISHSYVYPCTDDRFEEVMVYRHLDAVQRKIQSLGFSSGAAILDGPVPVHAHYFSDCNAFYDPADGGLHFGDSDICTPTADAAEDADVIVHEYGHAVQDDQIPAFGFGSALQAEQANAMGEGFSDFLAAATFGDSCIAEWLSFGGSCLRELTNTNQYPADFEACRPFPPPGQPVEPHCAGLIWGGALWDVAQALGGDQRARDLSLTLVLESHFMQHPLATFNEAASAIRQADQLLFGGAHVTAIDSVFSARGINDLVGIADFPYAYLRIDHTARGDLDIDLLVGSTSSPICSIAVWNPNGSDNSDDLVGYEDLGGSPCEANLPPTVAQPWYLRVRDVFAGDTGNLEEFEIVLNGSQRCVATDVPVSIPDAGGFVYSQVTCATKVTGSVQDDDGDGFNSATETYVGTNPGVPCGNSGWPADLVSSGSSANKLDLIDLSSFIAPVRRLNSSPGDVEFNVRWDLKPGKGASLDTVNLTDMSALIVLAPPMLGGQKAFGKVCP